LRFDHFFAAACSWLLSQKEFRILNSGWHEENGKPEIRLYKHVNIGLAVAIPPEKNHSGLSELVVPVIKHSEKLTFVETVKAAEELLAKERLGPEELNDLTFTINKVGSPGVWRGMKLKGVEDPNNPIVPPGTCALLGMGAIREENWQKKMRLVLGFNHKIVDGYEASLFLGALRHLIEHPELILALK
jgi:pyruvate/2-oxoglutarate dehydrogenase complex dihydrolipoamide acyltransferase (E2) component